MIRGGHFWVGLSTDRACVVVRTYMLNVNTSEPYRVTEAGTLQLNHLSRHKMLLILPLSLLVRLAKGSFRNFDIS